MGTPHPPPPRRPLGGSARGKGTAAVFSSRSGQGSDGVDTRPVSTGQRLPRSLLCPLGLRGWTLLHQTCIEHQLYAQHPRERPRCGLCGQPPTGSQRGCWQRGKKDRVQAPGKEGPRWRPDSKEGGHTGLPGSGPTTHLPTGGSAWSLPPAQRAKQNPATSLQTRFFRVPSQQKTPIHLFSPARRDLKTVPCSQSLRQPQARHQHLPIFKEDFPSQVVLLVQGSGGECYGVGGRKEKAKEGRDPSRGASAVGAAPPGHPSLPHPTPGRRADQESASPSSRGGSQSWVRMK